MSLLSVFINAVESGINLWWHGGLGHCLVCPEPFAIHEVSNLCLYHMCVIDDVQCGIDL